MIKKIIALLTGDNAKRVNIPQMRHEGEQKDINKEHAQLAKERHDEIMRNRDKKFVSERTTPTEAKITGPSESKSEEESHE